MDSYYSCIWDVTLLEFMINFLTKRGEHTRKQLAVSMKSRTSQNISDRIHQIKWYANQISQIDFIHQASNSNFQKNTIKIAELYFMDLNSLHANLEGLGTSK